MCVVHIVHIVHRGFVVVGLVMKWTRLFMSLDEEGTVLRWWKKEDRKSSDSAVYMK